MQQDSSTASRYHEPVMVAEVVRLLITARDGIYVDATVGGAGHAVEILKNLSSGAQYLGLDADPEAVVAARERLGTDRRVTIRQARFSQLSDILQALGLPSCDGIFADLGVSSHQLNEAGRGFSYLSEGPLDMRMDPTRGKSAFELLQTVDENTLSGILQKYGEERLARRIARAILKRRQQQPIRTTRELAGIVESVTPFQKRIKTLARVFQALRIAVNEELQELEKFLPAALQALKTGGRLVVIAYHSLEDRMVKTFMAERARGCICPPEAPFCTCQHQPEVEILTRKALVARKDEGEKNPRARSAKLRACEKIHS